MYQETIGELVPVLGVKCGGKFWKGSLKNERSKFLKYNRTKEYNCKFSPVIHTSNK